MYQLICLQIIRYWSRTCLIDRNQRNHPNHVEIPCPLLLNRLWTASPHIIIKMESIGPLRGNPERTRFARFLCAECHCCYLVICIVAACGLGVWNTLSQQVLMYAPHGQACRCPRRAWRVGDRAVDKWVENWCAMTCVGVFIRGIGIVRCVVVWQHWTIYRNGFR